MTAPSIPFEPQQVSTARSQRRFSLTGLAFVLCGLGMIIVESQTGLMKSRLGVWVHWFALGFGLVFVLRGLFEVVASVWPQFARQGQHLRLPIEGVIYLIIMSTLFVGAMWNRNNLLMMVFAAMIGPFLINGSYAFMMLRRNQVRRQAPDRVMAGETFGVVLELENRKSWLSVWLMTVQDRVAHASGVLSSHVLFARVPGASSRRGHYHLCLFERGRYEFGPCEATTRFPLGLVQRGMGLDVRHELRVYPRLGRLQESWRRRVLHARELVSQLRPAHGFFQDELHQLREFRPGDDPRLIHWRTSARMNELMICEFQESRDRDLNLIFDGWLPPHPSLADREAVERGLRFAATICMDYLRSSRQSALTVTLLGRELMHWRGDSADHSSDVLLDGFALLQSSSGGAPGTLAREIDSDWVRNCRTMVITTRPTVVKASLDEHLNGHAADVMIFGTGREELAQIFEEG